MERRAVLAGVAGLGAATLAGCAGVLGESEAPVEVRARRKGDSETDVRCVLPASLVAEHPPLEAAIEAAAERPADEWATRGVSTDSAEEMVMALESHCERVGGLYRYEGEWYLLSFQFASEEGADAHHGDGHEH